MKLLFGHPRLLYRIKHVQKRHHKKQSKTEQTKTKKSKWNHKETVMSLDLKPAYELRISRVREFQGLGEMRFKALPSMVVRWAAGIVRWIEEKDQREWIDVEIQGRFKRYGGAKSWTLLNKKRTSLYSVLWYGTNNMFRSGVMWWKVL